MDYGETPNFSSGRRLTHFARYSKNLSVKGLTFVILASVFIWCMDVDEEMGSRKMEGEKPIDVARNRYPYCIVWTPLPLIR